MPFLLSFHLLRRRFFGFACYESSQQKTHDFVFKGLLAKNEVDTIDYNRAFFFEENWRGLAPTVILLKKTGKYKQRTIYNQQREVRSEEKSGNKKRNKEN